MGRMRSKRWRVGVVAARTRAPSQWVRARAPVLYRLPSLGVSARGLFVAIVSSFSFHSPCCARIVFLCHRLRLCDAFSGAAAAAAGRGSPPPPGAGVRQTVAIPFQEHGVRGTRWYKARGAGGLGGPQLPAPAPPGAAFCGREQQGGLGPPQLPAPAPPGAAFAIPLERNGASGGWGPAVRNGAPVQARAHLLKNHALACTRA